MRAWMYVVGRRRMPKPKTFFRESKKRERHLICPARKRGTNASTPGINNKDRLKVLTALDRNQHQYDHILLAITGDEIHNCLGCKITDESISCIVGQPAYNKMCEEHHLHHVVLTNSYVKNGLYHIQNVNNYHSQVKWWYLRMHGVASKNLTTYLG